jgi:phosphocarrier protein HPr
VTTVGAANGRAQRTLRIRNKLGLHARAAVKFVQLATRFRAEIKVAKDGQEVNGKSIMGLLTLVAAFGMEIVLNASGPDAEEAVSALAALVDRGFDEGVEEAVEKTVEKTVEEAKPALPEVHEADDA